MKLLRLMKFVAAAQNLGGKVRRQTYAEKLGGNVLWQTYAEKFCGNLRRSVKCAPHNIR